MEEPHQIGDDGDLRNFNFQPDTGALDRLFNKLIKIKPADSISMQMVSMEVFELEYGLQKETDVPISLVTMSEQREFVKGSDWERTLKVLMKLKLAASTGMSTEKLLDLPRHRLQQYIDVASQVAREEPALMKQIEVDAEKSGIKKANS